MDRAQTTRIIEKLIELGYTENDNVGKRPYKVHLTAKGREISEFIMRENDRIVDKLLSGLTEEERETWARLWSKIDGNM